MCGHLAVAQNQREVQQAPAARKRSSLPCPTECLAGEALGTLPCRGSQSVGSWLPWENSSFPIILSTGCNHGRLPIYWERKYENHTHQKPLQLLGLKQMGFIGVGDKPSIYLLHFSRIWEFYMHLPLCCPSWKNKLCRKKSRLKRQKSFKVTLGVLKQPSAN